MPSRSYLRVIAMLLPCVIVVYIYCLYFYKILLSSVTLMTLVVGSNEPEVAMTLYLLVIYLCVRL